jgi:O-antigen/teichoic acid export membrane protein
MMNPLKRLAGQTAIYGLTSILGRLLGYLLVPLYTRVFATGEYGTVSVFYSYVAFLMVILTYGMETAFFKFNESEEKKEKVFSTGMFSLIVSSALFLFLAVLFSGTIARWIEYPDHPEYVTWFAWILALDALSAIPFAKLRAMNKAAWFAFVKMAWIISNIGLNLFFLILCPYILKHEAWTGLNRLTGFVYSPGEGIGYIFISNLVASALTLVLLSPQIMRIKWQVSAKLWRSMIIYAFPLLFAGMAGIVNETFDRLMLRYLLPQDIAASQVGIYSACYKISILMTVFIQAYRYAAEPFFFAQAKEKDAKEVYAKIMDYFIITVSLIFLVTMLYLDDFVMGLIGKEFRSGKGVIPILMLANLFLGVYYNLSIWYKLTCKTIWGAYLSIIGAVITLILNFYWIPRSSDHMIYGYIGSAWATFICYGSMMVISYLVGQKYFPVAYNLKKFAGYLGLAVLIYLVSTKISINHTFLRLFVHTLFLCIFIITAYIVEKPQFSKSR